MFADIWDEVSIFEEIIFFPIFYGVAVFGHFGVKCSEMGCLGYYLISGIAGYALIGIVISIIIYKIKKSKNKK